MEKLISFIKPVDAPSGNFWHAFTDLSIGGRGMPLDITRTYDSVSSSADGPFGYGWSFPYGMWLGFPAPGSGSVVVHEETGSQVKFSYQSDGSFAAPPRVIATLAHHRDGSWTFVRRHRNLFIFNPHGTLMRERDLNRYVTSLAYNRSGRLSTVTDPAGRKLHFRYSGRHISSVADPLGRVVHYGYDRAGNLTDVTDVNGGNTHFTYDSAHRMLTMRMPNQAPGVRGSSGAVVRNVYDSRGRVVAQTDQLRRKTTFSYSGDAFSARGGTTTVTDPKGNVTVQKYRFGELRSATQGYGTPEAATWKFEYDPKTLGPTKVTDPNGHTTTSKFDAQGNVRTTTDALGRTTTNTYGTLNDLLATKDPMGVTTRTRYDAHGNLRSRSRPLVGTGKVQTTTYRYGDRSHPGDLTSMTDPDGKTEHYTYDAYGNRTSRTDALGNETTLTYNTIGWLLSTTSPRGNGSGSNPVGYTARYTHDRFGDVTRIAGPLNHATQYTYDRDRNRTGVSDANGDRALYTYDDADQQIAAQLPNGATLRTTYWPDGTVKGRIDGAGHGTHYTYDSLGREIAVTDPLGRTTKKRYDGAGNNVQMIDAQARLTKMRYDAANERTSITYSDGRTPNVTGITYDGDGQRTHQMDGSGRWSWTWDSLHRLTAVTEGRSGAIRYRYNLRNLPTRITYPGGRLVTRGYDDARHLTTVSDWLGNTTTFHYDRDGNVIQERLPPRTGITDAATYAADDGVTSITDKRGATPIFAAKYSRDANGQIIQDTSQAAPSHSYPWFLRNLIFAIALLAAIVVCALVTARRRGRRIPDAFWLLALAGSTALLVVVALGVFKEKSRVVMCNTSLCRYGATRYTYDKANNLTQRGNAHQTFNQASELVSAASSRRARVFSYDRNGERTAEVNKTGGSAVHYTYNQALELTRVGSIASYAYNGDGLRVAKSTSGTVHRYAWDVVGAISTEISDGTSTYIYGPDNAPVEQLTGSTVLWLHHDQIGSTRVLTDGRGQAVGRYSYAPYGATTSAEGSASTPFRFAGQYQDSESGLYYLRARYYDPATAQFLTLDPAVGATLSPYTYGAGNPLNETDPTGLGPTNCGLVAGKNCDPGSLLGNWGSFFNGLGQALKRRGFDVGAVADEFGNLCGNAGASLGGLISGILDYQQHSDLPTPIRIAHAAATSGGAVAGAVGGAEVAGGGCAATVILAPGAWACALVGGAVGGIVGAWAGSTAADAASQSGNDITPPPPGPPNSYNEEQLLQQSKSSA